MSTSPSSCNWLFRCSIVLSDLEGKTRKEVARQLGWPEGSVASRLARARARLAKRLARYGLGGSGAAVGTLLSESASSASVPTSLVVSTVKAASLLAAGQAAAGTIPAQVAALMEGALKAMLLNKILKTTALLVVAAFVTGTGLMLAHATRPEKEAEAITFSGQTPSNSNGEALATLQPTATKKEGTIVRAPGSYTLAVALTANGRLLARGGADNTVDLWEVASGRRLHTLKGHTAPILRVAFSPDGKTLASITGSWLPDEVRGEVKLWDVASGKERVSLEGHPTRGLSLAFAPDGKTLASAAGTVKLWDVATGKERRELKLPQGSLPWSLAFSPDGKTLATGTGGGIMGIKPSSVILWEIATGKQRATLSGHGNSITWVGFTSDGKTLASASGPGASEEGTPLPGQIKLWDVVTAKERATIPLHLVSGFLIYTPLAYVHRT